MWVPTVIQTSSKLSAVLKQKGFSQVFPSVPFIILLTFSLCDGKTL